MFNAFDSVCHLQSFLPANLWLPYLDEPTEGRGTGVPRVFSKAFGLLSHQLIHWLVASSCSQWESPFL